MESEKVKEIKKVLEQNTKTCLLYDFGKNTDCKVFYCKDILDYINELESENEKLKNIGLNENITVGEYLREMQRLKDRVAELEKEIEENAFYSKGYAQGIKNTYEVVIPEKLKQFAERLKEDFTKKKNKLIKEREIAVKYDDFILIDALVYKIDEFQYAIDKIDETLKECIK